MNNPSSPQPAASSMPPDTSGRLKTVGIIPARLDSTRLPRKALADIGGKPLIQHVWERACQAETLDVVCVATDSREIQAACQSFGARVQMTGEHNSGSNRVAEAALDIDADLVMNIQGDEVFLEPELIDRMVAAGRTHNWPVTTAIFTLKDDGEDPSMVKAVWSADGRVLYFSRLPVPYNRDLPGKGNLYGHIGLYLFNKQTLLQFAQWPQSPLEKAESLEQLRLLEHNVSIGAVHWPRPSFGVDTPEDLERARSLVRESGSD
jgi:3-deoxy-manno-octulosonate cytidylyltransferase (CMP-KDO synthetase)